MSVGQILDQVFNSGTWYLNNKLIITINKFNLIDLVVNITNLELTIGTKHMIYTKNLDCQIEYKK